jgi:hypothetical protein
LHNKFAKIANRFPLPHRLRPTLLREQNAGRITLPHRVFASQVFRESSFDYVGGKDE